MDSRVHENSLRLRAVISIPLLPTCHMLIASLDLRPKKEHSSPHFCVFGLSVVKTLFYWLLLAFYSATRESAHSQTPNVGSEVSLENVRKDQNRKAHKKAFKLPND